MIKIYFDNNLINEEYYAGLTRSCVPYDENFKIGNTISESFKLTLNNKAFNNIPEQVTLYEDTTKIATLSVDEYKVNDFTTEFTLVDNMLKFNFPYDAPMINKSDIKNASGKSITITDSIDASVPRLRLNGYTKQDGTPTPDNPQEIEVATGNVSVKSTGKNLFDRTNAYTNFALNWGTGVNFEESGSVASLFIPTKVGDKFTINYSSQIMYYDKNKDYLGCLQSGGTTIAKTTGNIFKYFTTPNVEEICYMRLGVRKSSDDGEIKTDKDIMLNKEYVLEPYEPYQESSIIYNLGNNFLADKDYIENGVLHKNVRKYEVDTSKITLMSNYTNIAYAMFPKPTDYSGYNNVKYNPIVCNKAVYKEPSRDWDDAKQIGKISSSARKNSFWVGFSKETTLEQMKTALEGTIIYYPLTTPEQIQLTSTGDLTTYETTTYIDNDINTEMDLDYKCTQYTSLKEIFTDICLTAGVETTITDFYKSDMRVSWYNNSISAREYLGYIAEINGKNLEIDKDGKLAFRNINKNPSVSINFNEISDYVIGNSHHITRVVWDDTNNIWEAGTNDGDTYYINPSNVYCIDQEIVNHLLEQLTGLEFYDFKTNNCPTKAFCKGDLISFTDGTNIYNTFSKYSNITYAGGEWFGGIDLTLNTDKQEETQVIDTLQIVRGLKTIVDRDANKITQIAESTEINNQLANDINNDLQSYKESVTTELSSDKYNVNVLREELDKNGVKKVYGSVVTIDEQGLSVNDPIDPTVNTTMTNKEFQIKVNGKEHTFIGYDKNIEQSVARMNNLTITNYLVTGYHRLETFEPDGEKRTGIFYIGGNV